MAESKNASSKRASGAGKSKATPKKKPAAGAAGDAKSPNAKRPAAEIAKAAAQKPSQGKHSPAQKVAEKKPDTRRLNVSLAPGVRALLRRYMAKHRTSTGADKASFSRSDVINAALREFLGG